MEGSKEVINGSIFFQVGPQTRHKHRWRCPARFLPNHSKPHPKLIEKKKLYVQRSLEQNFNRCSIHQNVHEIDALQCSIFSKACSVSLPIRYDFYYMNMIEHVCINIYILEYPVLFIKAFYSECQLLTAIHQTSPLF